MRYRIKEDMLTWHENGRDKGAGSSQSSDSGSLSGLQYHSLRQKLETGETCEGVNTFLLTHVKFESLWKIKMAHIH